MTDSWNACGGRKCQNITVNQETGHETTKTNKRIETDRTENNKTS